MTEERIRKFKDYVAQCNGSLNFYRHGLVRSLVYTDGVKLLADTFGAHWFVDIVASYQGMAKVQALDFQVWKLEAVGDEEAVVKLEDGNNNEVLRQDVAYTDFPREMLPFSVWAERAIGLAIPVASGDGMVIMLPQER